MRDIFAAFLFCALIGLGGLGVASWFLIAGQSTASVDNLFLTLVALCLAGASLGYDVWLIRLTLAQVESKQSEARTRVSPAAADSSSRTTISAKAA
jgi:hypothetical protein